MDLYSQKSIFGLAKYHSGEQVIVHYFGSFDEPIFDYSNNDTVLKGYKRVLGAIVEFSNGQLRQVLLNDIQMLVVKEL